MSSSSYVIPEVEYEVKKQGHHNGIYHCDEGDRHGGVRAPEKTNGRDVIIYSNSRIISGNGCNEC